MPYSLVTFNEKGYDGHTARDIKHPKKALKENNYIAVEVIQSVERDDKELRKDIPSPKMVPVVVDKTQIQYSEKFIVARDGTVFVIGAIQQEIQDV